MKKDEVKWILKELLDCDEDLTAMVDNLFCADPVCCLLFLKIIVWLLTNRRYGLKEIKCEIKDIEKKLDADGVVKGPIGTGPIFVRTGQNNAINVKVQNVGQEAIDAIVRAFDIDQCPPQIIDEKTLSDIGGGCCAKDALLTVPAGNFEIVICPDPSDAAIRAFVSVHAGNSPTSAFEYVIKAAEMLPVVCNFCEVTIN